jgi:UDP-N-acetylglucosamine diphosphorylase / glucose-1-phosphate thymidylyltransferase / UDP-N-acetylgalactosamine diphosphorylase / glucosamine-1-phosphate N-acetyltransferase / galactosamine-1-phosphate N-acetyltransferase
MASGGFWVATGKSEKFQDRKRSSRQLRLDSDFSAFGIDFHAGAELVGCSGSTRKREWGRGDVPFLNLMLSQVRCFALSSRQPQLLCLRMPVFTTRAIEDFPIGNIRLREHHAALAAAGLQIHPHAWVDPSEVSSLQGTLVDAAGCPLAWRGSAPDPARTTLALSSFIIRYPWDLLRANELHISKLEDFIESGVAERDVHPSAVIEGTLHLGAGTRILPGVFIEGNVVIGKNCKIGPNCYIRGNTSIGDYCHIGQSVEIKNCLILANTNVGHLSYIGDSVLGEKVNLGAGTTTSNLRHDGQNHRSMVDGILIDTGRRKFGAIFGDGVHTGIHTSIYPGRQLWPNTTTRPGEIVQRDIQS